MTTPASPVTNESWNPYLTDLLGELTIAQLQAFTDSYFEYLKRYHKNELLRGVLIPYMLKNASHYAADAVVKTWPDKRYWSRQVHGLVHDSDIDERAKDTSVTNTPSVAEPVAIQPVSPGCTSDDVQVGDDFVTYKELYEHIENVVVRGAAKPFTYGDMARLCTRPKCKTCTHALQYVNPTPCSGHPPCHSIGYYPHIGKGLTAILKPAHKLNRAPYLKIQPCVGRQIKPYILYAKKIRADKARERSDAEDSGEEMASKSPVYEPHSP